MAQLPTSAQVAAMIDHALLAPNMTPEQLLEGCRLAAQLQLFSVCVPPAAVEGAVRELTGSGVKVGTVIGFPHGSTTPEVKRHEAEQSLRAGAFELDMVVNIGRLIAGDEDYVRSEIENVVAAASTGEKRIVKVILETAYLTDEQVVLGARLTQEAKADFVKTSTGFAGGGATVHHLHLMRKGAPDTQLKASGGVRDLHTLLEMVEAGATRIGTSASQHILAELEATRNGSALSGGTYSGAY